MSLGEACAALDAFLRAELPLAQDIAAGIPSVRTDLRGDKTASLFGETGRKGMSVRAAIPRGSVGREEEIIWHRALCALISSGFWGPLDKSLLTDV